MNKKGGRKMEENMVILLEIKKKLAGIDQRLDEMDKRLTGIDNKIDGKIDDLREEMNQRTKEILDQQFLFESEYGRKIDVIFDSVSLEMDKNLEKSEKIRKLDQRVERNEVNIFGLEKRVSTLELKQS